MYNNKYLELLHWAIINLRYRSRDLDKQSYDLLNAIHNIPSLLESKKEINDNLIISELIEYENKYLNWDPKFSNIIKNWDN